MQEWAISIDIIYAYSPVMAFNSLNRLNFINIYNNHTFIWNTIINDSISILNSR